MRRSARRGALALGLGAAIIGGASAAWAQLPALPPNPGEIAACLCLKQSSDALGADLAAKQAALDGLRQELDRLSAQMESERARVNVNDSQAVARFRQLLAQRDAAFQRSTGPAARDATAASQRYNARVSEYNARCANRPMDPLIVAQIQPTLRCPPP